MHHYEILSEYLQDDENPLEAQADEVAERDLKECLSYLISVYGEQNIENISIKNQYSQVENIYCQPYLINNVYLFER
jgi:hypothetical protein